MTLSPGERHQLARIERAFEQSDPGLAHRLTRGRMPVHPPLMAITGVILLLVSAVFGRAAFACCGMGLVLVGLFLIPLPPRRSIQLTD